jgi:hypothetical protein
MCRPYSSAFPELTGIYSDHPCTPVYNSIYGNSYCHTHSVGGGEFIDKTESVITGWLSTIANNTERC